MPSARSPSVRWGSSNSSGVGRRIAGALLAVSALACPTRSSTPGEPLGTFSFQATQIDGGCPENEFTVHETIRVVLLTQSQYAALDGGCSPAGGVAGAEAALDAGGPPPTRGPNGLDAVRACGLLIDEVQPAHACEFAPCSITFTLDGEPQ